MKRIMYLAAAALLAMLILAPAALAQTRNLDCSHFATQEAPQAILDAHPTGLDIYGLDPEGDRIACERLGGGVHEDGTLASVQQEQATAAGTGAAPLPGTGGPPLLLLLIPAAAALLLGSGILGLLAVGRNAKRLAAVVLAVALAMAIGAGFLGQARSALAQAPLQTSSPLYISKDVFPSPKSAIPVGTQMDFLITVVNNSPNFYRQVTLEDPVSGGVGFDSANASQGSCYAMADAPTVRCELGDMPPGNVVHVNIMVTAEAPGNTTNIVQDSLGNQATETYNIVRAR